MNYYILPKKAIAVIVVVVLALVILLAGCGSSTVSRADYYDPQIGLDYGYACDSLYIDDACYALYGQSYYDSGKRGYGKKRVKYATVKTIYVKKNASKISAFKTKAAESAKKAKVAAAKAAKAAASKPKTSSGSSFKSSASSFKSSSSSSSSRRK